MKQELERDLFGYQKEDADKILENSASEDIPLLDSSWCILTKDEVKWLVSAKDSNIDVLELRNSQASEVSVGYVRCEICGAYLKMIHKNHLRTHSMTLEEYIIKFPDSSIYSEAARNQQSRSHMGLEKSEETCELITQNNIRRWADPVTRMRLSIAIRKSMESSEFREGRRQISKDNWKDPEYIKKTMEGKNLAKENIKSPNLEEIQFWLWVDSFRPDSIIFNREWVPEAVLTPDFLVIGKKKVIEYFGTHWHDSGGSLPGMQALPEEAYYVRYKKADLECLIIWSDEMYQDSTQRRIEEFIDG